MYGKLQESELPEITAFICISYWGQYPVCFTTRAPLRLTIRSGRSLMAARSQVFFFLSSLWAHQLTLESCSHWWLWHPRLLSRKYSISRGQHEICVLEWFPVVQSLEDAYPVWVSGDCCHLRRAHVKAPVTDSSFWVVSKAAARSADFISFLFSHWRLLFMEEPREWLLVCAGPLLHPEWAWEEPGDLADPHPGEWQGGQALWIPVWWPTLPREEADSMCGLHAHQGTLLLKIIHSRGAFQLRSYGSFVDESENFFVMLLKDPEILKAFNFRKIIDSTGKKLSGAVLWSLTFQRLFFYIVIHLMTFSLKIRFVCLSPCCCT